MAWFWSLGRCQHSLVLVPRQMSRWSGFDSGNSRDSEVAWFYLNKDCLFWIPRQTLVWFGSLGRCTLLVSSLGRRNQTMTWLSPEKAQYVLYFRKGRPYPHHNVVRIGNYPHHNVVRISYYPHHNVVRTRYYPHHTLIAKDTKEKFKRKVSGTLSLVKTPLKLLTPLQILKEGAPNFWSSQGRSKF